MVDEICGVPARAVPRGRRGAVRATPAASARRRSATRSAGRSTRSASSTSAPRRSSSCCSATSAARAAGSWRCAGTRRSRARPTSRRSTTSCRATSRCRTRTRTADLDEFVELNAAPTGCWGDLRRLHRQPAEGVVGRRARPPRTTSASTTCRASTATTRPTRRCSAMLDGEVQGLLRARARTRPSARPTRGCTGSALAKLDWLVVRDFVEIETAAFWHDAPEIETGELRTEEIGTEVFFLPAAAHTEKDGTFTNTQRLLQWHHKAVEPPGDCRSELWFAYHLGRRIREKLARLDRAAATGRCCDLHLGLPDRAARTTSRAPRRCCARSTAGTRTGERCSAYTELKDDGSTACGCWIYCGCYADGVNQTGAAQARHASRPGSRPSGAGRGRRTGGSSTTAPRPTPTGKPWSERKRYVWWDERAGPLDGRRRARLRRRQAARLRAARRARRPRTRSRGDHPFIMQADGRGWLFAPQRARRRAAADALRAARVAGRQPALRAAARTRRASSFAAPRQPVQPDRGEPERRVPVRAHDLPADRAPHRRRHVADARRTSPSCSRRCSARSARSSRRARARARRLGDDRHRARRDRGARAGHRPASRRCACGGRVVHQVGLPYHWGTRGLSTGDVGERPVRARARPERPHPGGQGADLRHPPGRRPRGPALRELVESTARRAARERRDETPAMADVRRRGAAARRLLHRHERLHRLQGLRGRLQGVEPRARGRAAASPATRYDNTGALGANTLAPRRLHRAAQAVDASTPRTRRGRRRRLALADELATSASTARTPPASTSARPARSSAPSSAPSSCSRTSATAAATASRPARSACSTSARPTGRSGRRTARVEVHALLRPAQGRHGAGLRAGVPDRLDPVRRRSTSCASAPASALDAAARAGRRPARGCTATTRTTASAASARSSCCSTSRRSTGCRPTRSCRPRRPARDLGRGARRRRPRSSAASLPPSPEAAGEPRRRGPDGPSRSYYGRPVIKEPVWKPEIPSYFFAGGLAGASPRASAAPRGCAATGGSPGRAT